MILGAVYHTILAIFFAVVAILLMIVILLQRGRGVGLAGAFGGAGGASAFGAKTGDVLTWVTVVGAAVLLIFTVVLNFVFVQGDPGLGTPAVLTAPAGAQPPTGAGGAEPAPSEGGAPPAETPAVPPAGTSAGTPTEAAGSPPEATPPQPAAPVEGPKSE